MNNFTLTDSITAFILDEKSLLQGIGNKLVYHFLDEENQTNSKQFDLNLKDKIHKINAVKEDKWKILIQAGRTLGIFILDPSTKVIELRSRCNLNDWISTSCFSKFDSSRIFLVTITNAAVELISKDNKMELVNNCSSERCTLYCSTIEDRSGEWNDLLIYAGTAKSEVQIWKPSNSSSEILYSFSNSWGVIFSITLDPLNGMIFTTSDDRAATYWKLDIEQKTHKMVRAVFGHDARVFKSVLVKYQDENLLITIGEDSRICCWDMDGGLKFKKIVSPGAVLWDVVYDDKTETVFITSNDGNLTKLSLSECLEVKVAKQICESEFSKDFPAKVRFLNESSIICITSLNVLKLIVEQDQQWSVKSEFQLEDKVTVLETFGNSIVLAGGFVKLFTVDNGDLKLVNESFQCEGLIRSAHFLDKSNFLFVNSSGKCVLTDDELTIKKIAQIPKSKENWTTSAIQVGQILLASDRNGNLHSFQIGNEREMELKYSLRKVHKEFGITVLKLYEDSPLKCIIMSSGHDGTIKHISLNPLTGQLEILRTIKVPINWIERIENETVFGFNDKHFSVWNKRDSFVFEQCCGGRHRCWDLMHLDNKSRFLHIKNKSISIVDFPLKNNSKSLIKPETFFWHTNSTNVLEVFQINEESSLIFSGGEETLIKIHLLKRNSMKFQCEISSHISNVRSLAVVKESNNSLLLFSGGGRAQLCVSRVEINPENSQIRMSELINYMLKGNDLTRNRNGQHQSVDFNPETRFMSLIIDNFDIFIGCSDGSIRRFRFDLKDKTINLISTFDYGKCLLQIHLITTVQSKILIFMGTDGFINFSQISQAEGISTPFYRIKHHDSGVNSFDLRYNENKNVFYIGTGGDDQKITVSEFSIDLKDNIKVLRTSELPYEHIAQVTGIQIGRNGEFYTIGVDQQLLKFDLESLKRLKSEFSSISDVKGIRAIFDKDNNVQNLVVYGAGVDIIKETCKTG